VTTIVYLGAVGRSGTTLLERVAATSPDITCLGEVVHLWERGLQRGEPCGCGLPLRDCPTWSEIGRRAFGGWDRLDVEQVLDWKRCCDRNRYVPALVSPRLGSRRFRRALTSFGGVLDRLYDAIGEVAPGGTGAPSSIVIDASKHPSYLYVLRRSARHDVRLLHVVRDPRGVAHSWSKRVRRPEAGDDMEQLGMWHAAARWCSHNLLLRLAAWTGTPTRRLAYERFTEEPAALGAEIAALVPSRALRPPAIAAERAVVLGVDHTVSGNPMRFRTGEIHIRSDEAWRSAMPRWRRVVLSTLLVPTRLRGAT
jgi:hypothetical protein